jgi:glucosamine-6-phosphate deaminase
VRSRTTRRCVIPIRVFDNRRALGEAAAAQTAAALVRAIGDRGEARLLAATGASQFELLDALTRRTDIDWPRVEMFHLDEYIGLPESHPASFRRYLRERLIEPTGITRHHLLDGNADPGDVCMRAGAAIQSGPIDCACIGIGENGHLAFNDPPADFETAAPFIVVHLDEASRTQQVGEGWFPTVEDVPPRAITISVRQIMAAREIVCVVPDARKAQAVRRCLEGPVDPGAPASILQTHPNVTIYLDTASAALLSSLPAVERNPADARAPG